MLVSKARAPGLWRETQEVTVWAATEEGRGPGGHPAVFGASGRTGWAGAFAWARR